MAKKAKKASSVKACAVKLGKRGGKATAAKRKASKKSSKKKK